MHFVDPRTLRFVAAHDRGESSRIEGYVLAT